MKKPAYPSNIARTVHKTARGLRSAGAIDKTTMREFDALCLSPVAALTPREIQKIRTDAGVSQEVFARYLNVGVTLVSQWERGEKKPSGPSLKLLSLVRKRGLDAIA